MSIKEDDFCLTDNFKNLGQKQQARGALRRAILDAMSWYEKNHGSGLYIGQIYELITQKRIEKKLLKDSSRISSAMGYSVHMGLIERRKDRKYYLLKSGLSKLELTNETR